MVGAGNMMTSLLWTWVLIAGLLWNHGAHGEGFYDEGHVKSMSEAAVVEITPDNVEEIKKKWHYLFIDFFADWCPYCRRLHPVWERVAQDLKGTADAVLAKVDCVKYPHLGQQFGVTKFPTMKMMRNGELSKNEYRGPRTQESITAFFLSEVDEKSNHATTVEQLEQFVDEGDKRIIVGFFTKGNEETSEARKMFEKVSDHMRDDCKFIEVHDPAIMDAYQVGDGTIIYKTDHDHNLDEMFNTPDTDFEESALLKWATKKCIPLVKEATRYNVEGLAEEGKPFFIMFYDDTADDGSSVRLYKQTLESYFEEERDTFNFLYADGNIFPHPLKHMGMSRKDMPVVAIDTFKHMYPFKDFKCIAALKTIQKFVDDFKSGILHDVMLNGENYPYACDKELDEYIPQKGEIKNLIEDFKKETDEMEVTGNTSHDDFLEMQQSALKLDVLENVLDIIEAHEEDQKENRERGNTGDPDMENEMNTRVHDSVFVKLQPQGGSGRYSMIRDEL